MSGRAEARVPMPPWHQFGTVLAPAEHEALLAWTIGNRGRFKPAGLAELGVDRSKRVAEKLKDLGPLERVFEQRIGALLPEIFARTGTRPFEVEHLELEIAAHGDGAFFARHSDMAFGPGRRPLGGDDSGRHDRLISAVYYYHREPKAFAGGALRLHRFGGAGGADDHVDIEPAQNSLVVFPSWTQHEVMRVECPGGAFEDFRFAVNAWLCRSLS